MSAADKLNEEMIGELLARRQSARTKREALRNAAAEIQKVEETLAAIDVELQAYGYREPPPSPQAMPDTTSDSQVIRNA